MAEILTPKVHASGLGEVVALGLSKKISETALAFTPVGNGTVKSAIVKGVIGGVAYGRAGKIGNIIAGGLVIDAVEDAINALVAPLIEGALGGSGGSPDAW